jgi:hypothetical protein
VYFQDREGTVLEWNFWGNRPENDWWLQQQKFQKQQGLCGIASLKAEGSKAAQHRVYVVTPHKGISQVFQYGYNNGWFRMAEKFGPVLPESRLAVEAAPSRSGDMVFRVYAEEYDTSPSDRETVITVWEATDNGEWSNVQALPLEK